MNTMGGMLRNRRIVIATLVALLLVTGSYFLARGVIKPPAVEASQESALLKAIAATDSDGDGLPDWEEALYGTDPHVVDSFHLGMSDGQAVTKGLIIPKAVADIPTASSTPISPTDKYGLPPPPAEGTLTDTFAKNFFLLYVEAKQNNGGADLSEVQMQDIATRAISSLTSSVTLASNYKTAADLSVNGSGPDALQAFAADAEGVLKKNTADAQMGELDYLNSVLTKGDTTAISHISSIAKAYRDSAVGIAALPVPRELADDDLILINTLMRLSQVINDFTLVNSDSIAAMLALQQYPTVSHTLSTTFIHIYDIYKSAGVLLPAGTPGAAFVNTIASVAASQAAAKKP
jgi:hypothetical protein